MKRRYALGPLKQLKVKKQQNSRVPLIVTCNHLQPALGQITRNHQTILHLLDTTKTA